MQGGYPPQGHIAGVYEAEAAVHGQRHAKDDGGVHKLFPALGEIAKGFNGNGAGHQIHHKQFHTVAAENEQRQQANHIHRQHQALAEESQKVQGKHRERHHIKACGRGALQYEGYYRSQKEHAKKVEIAVLVVKYGFVGEENAEVQHHHQRQGQEGVAQIQQNARGAVTEHLVVFRLVGIQNLSHLGGDNLTLGDYFLIGPYIAQGGRNVV